MARRVDREERLEPIMIPELTMPFSRLTEPECWAIIVAAVMMAFDVLTGLLGAVVRHDFQSSKMRDGIGHKAMLVLVVALAVVVQGATDHIGDMGWSVPLIVPACVYIIVMEVASVLDTVAVTYPDVADSPLFHLFDNAQGGDADE